MAKPCICGINGAFGEYQEPPNTIVDIADAMNPGLSTIRRRKKKTPDCLCTVGKSKICIALIKDKHAVDDGSQQIQIVDLDNEKEKEPLETNVAENKNVYFNVSENFKAVPWEDPYWHVLTLPVNLSLEVKHSDRLKKYQQTLQGDHNRAVEALNSSLATVNGNFDEIFCKEYELVRIYLINYRAETRKTVQEAIIEPAFNVNFENINFKAAVTGITQYNANCKERLALFNATMVEMERERSLAFDEVFNCAMIQTAEIGFWLQAKINEYFGNTRKTLNEVIAENNNMYADRCELLLQSVKKDVSQWTLKLNDNKRRWWRFIKENGYSIGQGSKYYIKICMQNQSRFENAMNDADSIEDFHQIHIRLVESVNDLDNLVQNYLRKCKFAILKIFLRNYKELKELDGDILLPEGSASMERIQTFRDELFHNLDSAYAGNVDIAEQLERDNWNEVLAEMREKLDYMKLFLRHVAHAWDDHYQRVKTLREIVTQDLMKTIDNNDAAMQLEEQCVNVVSDECRCARSKEVAKTKFGWVVAELKSNETLMTRHRSQEDGIITRYLEYSATEADILQAELLRFLRLHPRDRNVAPGRMGTRGSRLDLTKTQKKPAHVLFMEFRILALNNWIHGLWETIETNLPVVTEEVLHKAEEWSTTFSDRINMRYKQKFAIYKLRYYRIWLNVYKIRLLELDEHESRFHRHTNGVNKVISNLYTKIEWFRENAQQMPKDQDENLALLQEQLKKATHLEQICSIEQRIASAQADNIAKICQTKEQEMENIRKDLNFVLFSNTVYLTQMKMFGEEGSFNADEVKGYGMKTASLIKVFGKLQEKTKKELLKISSFTENTLKNYTFRSALMEIKEELTFRKAIDDNISSLQDKIRPVVRDLKLKRSLMNSRLQELDEHAQYLLEHMEDATIINDHATKCKICIAEIIKWRQSLQRPENYGPVEEPSKNNRYIIKFSIAEDCTINHILRHIQKYFQKAENIARQFYCSATLNFDGKRVQETYGAFISCLLSKYFYLQLQCDAAWLDEAIEYISTVCRFRNGITTIYTSYMNNYMKSRKDSFNSTYQSAKTAALSEININMKKVNDIHKLLKPLHGHPRNAKLLEDLQQKFMDEVAKIPGVVDESIGEFRQCHQTTLEDIERCVSERDEAFLAIIDDYDMQNLMSNMYVVILNLYTYLQDLMGAVHLGKIKTDTNDEGQTSVKDKIAKYLSSFAMSQIPQELLTRFSVTSSLKQYSSSLFDFDDNLLVNLVDRSTYLMELEEAFLTHSSNIKRVQNACNGDQVKWLQMWENDVLAVKNLYKVKYNIPDNSAMFK